MEMASFWLEEKQLVHKLFKVLAPRFKDYQVAYTALYKAPKKYPLDILAYSVLELRGNTHLLVIRIFIRKRTNLIDFLAGNPFPPLVFDGSRNKFAIHNVLLEEARREFRKEKYAEIAAKVASSENQEQSQKKSKTNEEPDTKSKAAQDVSEAEQLLKFSEPERHDDEPEVDQNNPTLDKPLPVA